jgi:hypothetical protein
MKRIAYFGLIAALMGTAAFAEQHTDQATLKDLQPTNFDVAKKQHQQYDFTLLTANRSYSCRTPANKKIDATRFLVGSTVTFVSNDKNGEVKTTDGKTVKCLITRVAELPAGQP